MLRFASTLVSQRCIAATPLLSQVNNATRTVGQRSIFTMPPRSVAGSLLSSSRLLACGTSHQTITSPLRGGALCGGTSASSSSGQPTITAPLRFAQRSMISLLAGPRKRRPKASRTNYRYPRTMRNTRRQAARGRRQTASRMMKGG